MQIETHVLVRADSAAIFTRLRKILADSGGEWYLVGGYVRDGLLGRPSHDIDLTVRGDAVAIASEVADALSGKFVLLDEAHQVARVVLMQSGERWYVDFAAMRGSIESDLGERDFTVDAIAVGLAPFEVGLNRVECIDPLGGLSDLEGKRIRAASDSVFRDDPARLLRAFRLAAELGFSMDGHTETLIERDGSLVTLVAGERVREELVRILETDRAAETFRRLNRLGLLDLLIPELAPAKGVTQPKEHFWDVFDHSLETVAAVERLLVALTRKGDLLDSFAYSDELARHFGEGIGGGGLTRRGLLKLTALLHDVAKPQARTVEENGRIRFLGHSQIGADVADAILERFRFSSRERKVVTATIDQHLRPGHLSNAPELPTRRAIYRYFRDTGDVGIDTLFFSLADHLATRGPAFEMEGWRDHVKVTEHMLAGRFAGDGAVPPPRLLDGNVLIDKFGLVPGPQVGKLLEAVREAQASGEIETEEDALDFIRKELGTNHVAQR